MDTDRITKQLAAFIARHSSEFYEIPRMQTQLLELGAATLAAEHYRLYDYEVTVENAVRGRFRVKVSSRGDPWNYSWFSIMRDDRRYEIHTNLAVESAYGEDGGRYVLDVAVCQPGRVPRSKGKGAKWEALPNRYLVSFLEAKKLVVYPMLLAQFLGIVHEVKPRFLQGKPKKFALRNHFVPSLVSTGNPAGTSKAIAEGFRERGIAIAVIPNFDVHLSNMRKGYADESPFDDPLGGPG